MRRAIGLLALVAGGCATPRPAPATVPPRDAATRADDAAVRDVVPTRAAHLRVIDALADAPRIDAAEATWLPSRILGALVDATGALPAPTPPRREGDRVTWSLVAPPEAASMRGACDAIARFDPRVVCAVDSVRWAGTDRARLAVGWRAEDHRVDPTVAQPLRALSRLAPTLCVRSIQRTLRTLDLTVHVDAHPTLGRALAMLATAPGLRDLILVRAEPAGGGLDALLSWPIERIRDAPASLDDDPWPARCGGASRVAEGAPPGTLPTLRALIGGRSGRGAVLGVGRQEWLLTVGDLAAGATIASIEDDRVVLRRPGRPLLTLRLGAPTVRR